MHDLATICRRNADALLRSIERFAAQGRYVVATYYADQIGSVETFSDEGEAFATLNAPMTAGGDVYRKLVPPARTNDFTVLPRSNGDFSIVNPVS